MCQAIVRFCSDSARPILIAGSVLTLLAALGVGYVAYSSNAIYEDIGNTGNLSTHYYLQLSAAGYLILVAVLGCFAANYDHKHAIRGLSIVTSINFVLAVVAVILIIQAEQPSIGFKVKLDEMQQKYPLSQNNTPSVDNKTLNFLDKYQCCQSNTTKVGTSAMLPRTCCSGDNRTDTGCKTFDGDNSKSCESVVDSTRFHLIIVLALSAVSSLYVAIVSGVRAYKTLPYVEASQNAYS